MEEQSCKHSVEIITNYNFHKRQADHMKKTNPAVLNGWVKDNEGSY